MGNHYSKHETPSTASSLLPLHGAEKDHQSQPGLTFSFSWFLKRCTKRASITCLVLIALVVLTAHKLDLLAVRVQPELPQEPPLYSDYHQRELALPQHNPNLPYPEGRSGRYLWIANKVNGVGWGNALQEFLLNSYLAHEAGWTHVFDNYTWDRYGEDYTSFKGRGKIPSRTPYSVMIQGPVVGGPWPKEDSSPRAVIKEYWDEVCPERTIINPRDVDGSLPGDISLPDLIDVWIKKLNSIPDRCVEIKEDELQVFSFWIFGSGKRLLPVWPSFSKSPIITGFRWSKLIESGVRTNLNLVSSFFTRWRISDYPYKPIPGLLALHVRRGDFDEACGRLSDWASEYNAFNTFSELPDHFVPPPGSGWGSTSPEAKEIYWKSCFPTIEQIVARVGEVKRTKAGQGLKNVYIMTNGDREFVQELKGALNKDGSWNKISSSRDLELTWEQKYVAQSVDMLIGQRAQVIIGNGWSSLTSNIVMFRMASGVPPESTRFW